ncbi:MAG: TLD domain-containing protein [archaeon]|nr:TLD domain-containing protein [archaeon]
MDLSKAVNESNTENESSLVGDINLLDSVKLNDIQSDFRFEPSESSISLLRSVKSKNGHKKYCSSNCLFFFQILFIGAALGGGIIMSQYLKETNQINKKLELEKKEALKDLSKIQNENFYLKQNLTFSEKMKQESISKIKDLQNKIDELSKEVFEGNCEELKKKYEAQINEFKQSYEFMYNENELLKRDCSTFCLLHPLNSSIEIEEKIKEKIEEVTQENIKLKLINGNYSQEIDKKNKEIDNYNSLIDSFRDYKIELETKNDLLTKNYNVLSSYVGLIKNELIQSKIINTYDEYMILKGFFKDYIYRKGITFEQIYDSYQDGQSYKKFHSKIKHFVPIVVLIETKEGFKFGGFTTVDLQPSSEGIYKEDEEAFLFNLDQNKKYEIVNPKYAIKADSNNDVLFTFGQNDLVIPSYYGENKCTSEFPQNYGIGHENFELAGAREFYIKKLEIFIVNY